MRLVDDWRKAHRFNTIRLALFFSVLNGAVVGLAALQDVINPWAFLGLNMAGYGAIGLARITHQPGLDD